MLKEISSSYRRPFQVTRGTINDLMPQGDISRRSMDKVDLAAMVAIEGLIPYERSEVQSMSRYFGQSK